MSTTKRLCFYFDDKIDNRKYRELKSVSKHFWYYQLESGHRKYIVLSEERLDLENCIIEGMLVKLKDDTLIGENKKLSVNLPIIFANKVTKRRTEIKSNEQLIDLAKKNKLHHENYFKFLFSHEDGNCYNHPQYFQYLISSWLLSRHKAFPLHLMIIAEPGTGKSTLEEAIWEKFDEDVEVVEGSCSTMKSLIPSFKGNLPEPGALLKANRICVIDELLRILMRTDKDLKELQLSSTNPILEHKKNRRVSSGNGSIKFNPTARVLAVTNPIWGSSNMNMMAKHFDNSFLSRWLIWYQDQSHVNIVQSGKTIEEQTYKIDKDDWLSIIDYLHSIDSKYDKEKVYKILKMGDMLIGNYSEVATTSNLKNIYSARYRHHIECLIDGIIKTRCLCSYDPKFKATAIDYANLKSIWLRMVAEWEQLDLETIEDINDKFY